MMEPKKPPNKQALPPAPRFKAHPSRRTLLQIMAERKRKEYEKLLPAISAVESAPDVEETDDIQDDISSLPPLQRFKSQREAYNYQPTSEESNRILTDHTPHIQAASRRLQAHLGVFDDTPWAVPTIPTEDSPDIPADEAVKSYMATNTEKLHAALEMCNDYALPMNRESAKRELLDMSVLRLQTRSEVRAEDEMKAEERRAEGVKVKNLSEGPRTPSVTSTEGSDDTAVRHRQDGHHRQGVQSLPSELIDTCGKISTSVD